MQMKALARIPSSSLLLAFLFVMLLGFSLLGGLFFAIRADAAFLKRSEAAEIFLLLEQWVSPAAASTTVPLPAAALAIAPDTASEGVIPEAQPVTVLASAVENPEAQPVTILASSQEITATVPLTPIVSGPLYLPLVFYPKPPPPEPRSLLACTDPGRAVPDNAWITDNMTVDTTGKVVGIKVYTQVNHSLVGDVTMRLEHDGKIAKLFDRPGWPGSADYPRGCEQNNIRAIFDDGMELYAENKCLGSGVAIGGSFLPESSLSDAFFNTPAGGSWGLRVVDEGAGDTGTLVRWCLDLTIVDGEPDPLAPPEPVSLPDSAYVDGMWGAGQALPLDCESRSAVDWARHWGYNIGEFDFFYGLPVTNNPETGFVGNVNGVWGQVPPDDYGVHAEPIAERLRDYGLPAEARKYMSWDDARAELAAGRPVVVWILGTVGGNIPVAPRYYAPGGSPYTVTAPFEHTMVLVGYDANNVWLLNGSAILTRSLDSFLLSWSALSNQGVVYVP